jgi:hypothetical protein
MQQFRWLGKVLPQHLSEVQLVILSDLHYGNPYCSEKHFLRTVGFIAENEKCYCLLNGDLCEAAIRTSVGDIYKQVGSPDDQKKQIVKWLLPIKDKILGMTTGNHEQRIYRESGTDISDYIAEKLGIPYRQEGMLFKLSFGTGNNRTENKPYVFWVYITHGYGGARTKAAKAVKAERLSYWQLADVFAMSHDHEVNVAPSVRFVADPRGSEDMEGFISGVVREKRIMLIKTNAYVKFGGYAEMGGFGPTDLSTPIINLLTPSSHLWEMCPDKPDQGVKVLV